MAIFTRNPARIRRIWPFSRKTRRGWGEYGYIYRKPGGDWMNMAISIENPPGVERIYPYLPKTRGVWDKYSHSFLFPGGFREDGVRIFHILIEDGR